MRVASLTSMASKEAPTLTPQHLGNILRREKKRENAAKSSGKKSGDQRLTKKNILLSPYQLVWPQVETNVEENIMDSLLCTLKKFPRLCPEMQKRESASTSDVSAKVNDRTDDTEEDMRRRKLRVQLALGHRQASKCLERDQLSLLLVWGQAEPAFITKCFIPLAATRLCPALCLQSLAPKLIQATGLTTVVALGFRKPLPGLNDFEDFVKMAAGLALPLSVPWMKAKCKKKDDRIIDDGIADNEEITWVENKGNESIKEPESRPVDGSENADSRPVDGSENADSRPVDGSENADRKAVDGSENADSKAVDGSENKDAKGNLVSFPVFADHWPEIIEKTEQQILGKLVGLLTPYRSVFRKPKFTFRTDEWKKQRKIIRDHLLTDPTSIRDLAKSGKLCLLLVQKGRTLHPSVVTPTMFATGSRCPVLVLKQLRKQLASVIRNPLLAVMGFRKCDKPCAEFLDFTTFACQHVTKDLEQLFPQITKVVKREPFYRKFAKMEMLKNSKISEKSKKSEKPAPCIDVSHLYIYKNNSVNSEAEKDDKQLQAQFASPSQSFSNAVDDEGKVTSVAPNYISLSSEGKVTRVAPNYVSLSSEPVVEIVGGQSGIFVDKMRSKINFRKPRPRIKEDKRPKFTAESFVEVLGLDDEKSKSITLASRPTPRQAKSKRASKRKLKQMVEDDDEFPSFSLYPANIRTSISNVNKAKKKRKL